MQSRVAAHVRIWHMDAFGTWAHLAHWTSHLMHADISQHFADMFADVFISWLKQTKPKIAYQ